MASKRLIWILVAGVVLALGTAPVWAAEEKEQKQVVRGPAEVTFGQMLLAVGQGASAEVQYRPEQTRLTVKSLAGEARIITSARNLLFVENVEGKVQVLLTSTGRIVAIDPGKSEIFGRAIVNDPGQIIVMFASRVDTWILGQGQVFPVSRPETSTMSPTAPAIQGFGSSR